MTTEPILSNQQTVGAGHRKPTDAIRERWKGAVIACFICLFTTTLIAAFKWSDGLFWGVFWNWIVGFAIALIGGYIGSALWYQMLTTLTGCEEHQEEQIEEVLFTTGVLTGTVERFFFTVGLGMDFAGMAVAMMVWTTIKLQSHYHIFGESKPNSTLNEAEPDFRRLYRALLSSLGSLFFALIGSWVCRHGLGLWKS